MEKLVIMKIAVMQAFCALVLLMMACSLTAQMNGPHHVGNSPRTFVEKFYTWYVPRALSDDTTAGWNKTLKSIRSDMSPQLVKLLEEDSAAQAKCEELVGLDFDPFLNTQDPAERYEVGKIAQKGKRYQAEIYSVRSGQRSEKPDVIAEVAQRDGHWFFVNFSYSSIGTDLVKILKLPRPACSVPRTPRADAAR
jgi:hypothetical protein